MEASALEANCLGSPLIVFSAESASIRSDRTSYRTAFGDADSKGMPAVDGLHPTDWRACEGDRKVAHSATALDEVPWSAMGSAGRVRDRLTIASNKTDSRRVLDSGSGSTWKTAPCVGLERR